MRIVKAFSPSAIDEAAAIIKRGGVIVYPTDTVYGIGCDPFNREAVKRVREIKRRERKPMPVLGASLADLAEVCRITEEELRIASLFWPGPLSIIVKKHPSLPLEVTAGQEDVAVRIPASLPVLEVIRLCGRPLVGTSANISGQPPPSDLDGLSPEIARAVDLVIDGGRTRLARASSVIRIRGDELLVLREEALSSIEIEDIIRAAGLRLSISRR